MRITSLNQDKPGFISRGLKENMARKLVFRLFERIQHGSLNIEEDGQVYHFGELRQSASLAARISVHDARAWMSVLQGGTVAAGEAYMHGYWETPDLVALVRLMVTNMTVLQTIEARQSLGQAVLPAVSLAAKNSQARARDNIAAHYDLNNTFFALLDESMAYSAGIFRQQEQTLEQASVNKFDHICQRLKLTADDHLLEIGTGWGGLAIHAAKYYGCKVTSTTLSEEQLQWARDWVQREGLGERITLLHKDYRELEGQYDKLVSVEMIEAVGAEYYDIYFRKCSELLKPDGLMLIQAITIPDQRYAFSLRNVDFIKRYIFPGGQLPCNVVIAENVAEHTDMQIIGLEDMTLDYALTLRAWRERFWANIEQVRLHGADQVFIRMWDYYLAFCEGGFLERVIHTTQFLMAKPGYRPARLA